MSARTTISNDDEKPTSYLWRAPRRVLEAARAEAKRSGVSVNMLVSTAVSNYLSDATSTYVQTANLVASQTGTLDALALSSGGVSPTMNSMVVTHYNRGYAALDHYASAVDALAGTPKEDPCGSTSPPTTSPATRRRKSARTAKPPESARAVGDAGTPGDTGTTTAARRSSSSAAPSTTTTAAPSTRSRAKPPNPKESK